MGALHTKARGGKQWKSCHRAPALMLWEPGGLGREGEEDLLIRGQAHTWTTVPPSRQMDRLPHRHEQEGKHSSCQGPPPPLLPAPWRHMEAFSTENKEGPGNRMGNFKQLKGAKRGKHGLIPQTGNWKESQRPTSARVGQRGAWLGADTARNGFEAGPSLMCLRGAA